MPVVGAGGSLESRLVYDESCAMCGQVVHRRSLFEHGPVALPTLTPLLMLFTTFVPLYPGTPPMGVRCTNCGGPHVPHHQLHNDTVALQHLTNVFFY